MEHYVMDEFNYLLILVIFMLFVTVFMDLISLFMVKRGSVTIEEYAGDVLKWAKVVLIGIFGVVMLYYAFTTMASAAVLICEILVGVLLIADCIVSAVLKIKYGKKK